MNILKFKNNNSDYKHLVINGDNMDTMPTLYSAYKNNVDFVYIDIPYNVTKDKYYMDNEDSVVWGNGISKRLMTLKDIIKNTGLIAVHIDNGEKFHLKLICDSVFGCQNFIDEIVVIGHANGRNDGKFMSKVYDSILLYAKNKNICNTFKLSKQDHKHTYVSLRYSGTVGDRLSDTPTMWYPVFYNKKDIDDNGITYDVFTISKEDKNSYLDVYNKNGLKNEDEAVSFMLNNIIPKYISSGLI